ncbi:hypothetical protein LSUE1_G002834 [Lachnellula suecica]|uniref:Wax synthase domain-containing protein n=1 Tax=Lachnellula suecica TaxID=602035 RepID=A0A8T9CAH0_9HELO|nr:hypothetical protein LSUE1_G002834 [Lachnellula suecica]
MATFFPHLTATGPAPPAREVAAVYQREFYKRVAEGSLRPIVLPYHLYGLFLLVVYLLIPHTKRPWLYKARWLVLGVITAFQWKTLGEVSSASLATSFAAGLVSAWGVVESAMWLVFYRPQFDSKRVQPRVKSGGGVGNNEEDNSPHNADHASCQLGERPANGHANGKAQEGSHSVVREHGSAVDDGTSSMEYYWQPYPKTLGERIPWILDHTINFRGPGWNWAVPSLPPFPPAVKRGLGEASSIQPRSRISKFGLKRFDTRRELFWGVFPKFVLGYFLLDVMKTFMVKDPYFIFGPTTYALPSYLQGVSPIAVYCVRQIITFVAVILALDMVFMLGPIVCGLLLGPKVLGLRGEPWQYPTTFGPFANVLYRGLGGLWGGYWHQSFRFAFSAPTNYLLRSGYIEPRSWTAALVGLIFAFGVSGFLHAWGSITQLPHTYPWHMPLFFMLQIPGIIIQSSVSSHFKSKIEKLPMFVRMAGNLAFAALWLLSTSWLLTDDFARGGIWLVEPVPISPMRGLGFGDEGDGWWCWGDGGVGWYTGKHWWESGIAL